MMPTLAIFIQHNFGSHSHSNCKRKTKGIQIGMEEVKLSSLVDDVILHRKSWRHHHKTMRVFNKSGKVAGYKVNIQKPSAFLHNNKLSEREI